MMTRQSLTMYLGMSNIATGSAACIAVVRRCTLEAEWRRGAIDVGVLRHRNVLRLRWDEVDTTVGGLLFMRNNDGLESLRVGLRLWSHLFVTFQRTGQARLCDTI